MIEHFQTSLAQFFKIAATDVALNPLAGDASTRQYWRVNLPEKVPYRTAILMWMPEVPKSGEPDFINVQRYLKKIEVQVPEIYHYDKKNQTILLEDCSDNLLQNAIQGQSEKQILNFYNQALEELFKMQFAPSSKKCVAFDLAFDTEKLNWELQFFKQNTLIDYLNLSFNPKEEKVLDDAFLKIAQFLSKQPRYLAHRDYHSRNLFVQDNTLRVIDFQDARMGPSTYDFVSLVFDTYVTLPRSIEKALTENFYSEHKETSEKELDWMLLQRVLKAGGTFGYMGVKKGKTSYLPYLPRVFDLALTVLEKYPELNDIKEILEPLMNSEIALLRFARSEI